MSMLFFTLSLNFLVAQTGVSQSKLPINEETRLITYTKVVETPGVNKTDLYDKAFNWLSSYYKNPADVLREKDRDAGMMTIKARFRINNPPDKKSKLVTQAGDVQYTLKLEFKDGKFRYTLTEINWKQISYFPAEKWMDKSNQYYSSSWNYYLNQTDENCNKIIADLVKSITAARVEKKDNW